jgi:hypothetical protein
VRFDVRSPVADLGYRLLQLVLADAVLLGPVVELVVFIDVDALTVLTASLLLVVRHVRLLVGW